MTWYGLRQQTEKHGDRRRDAPQPLPGRLCRAQGAACKRRTTSACSPSPPASASRRRKSSSPDDHDDYSAIMLKALADRLAEAFAERLHQRVRTDLWGYAPDEALTHGGADRREIPAASAPRPATRPARTTASSSDMFELLQADDIGMALTESLAMTPAASVSGFYLATRRPCTSTSARSATTRPRIGRGARRSISWRRGATSRPRCSSTAAARAGRRVPAGCCPRFSSAVAARDESDDQEVRGGQRPDPRSQLGKLQREPGSVAIAVVVQRADRPVVDDAVIRICSGLADAPCTRR